MKYEEDRTSASDAIKKVYTSSCNGCDNHFVYISLHSCWIPCTPASVLGMK